MSEPEGARGVRRRRWWTGAAVALAVLVVGLVVLALVPRSATATASLTVTPRTDAGAEAAVLLADRYAALAGSPDTLRAARQDEPALADVPLDDLESGTRVERTPGTAAIAVRVTLPDREIAAAAANAVVQTLVAAGAGEDLVDVAGAAEATPSRATRSPDLPRWTVVVVLLALAGGLTAAALAGRTPRRSARAAAGPSTAGPFAELDDLPGFLDSPPGSVPALPPPAAAGATVVEHPAARVRAPLSAHAATIATGTSVLVLLAAAVLVAVPVGRSGDAGTGTASAVGPVRTTGPAAPSATPTPSVAPAPDPTAAAALAFQSVPLGTAGVAAGVTFEGVVLEQRAVGLTITYPSVSVSTDGGRSLAHVRLPTFNCLTTEAPTDPVAAGCAPSRTEYADLPSPQLQLTWDGDRIDLSGLFPTYTRPNGSPPAYTGRAYQLTVGITAAGPERSGTVPATGFLRLGLESAAGTAAPGVNVLQFPG